MVQHPVGEDVEPALGRHDGEALWQVPLRLGEEVRVEGELEDGAGPRLGGELGVDDLVGPGAEVARNFDAPEDIRAAGPPALLERPLGDDVQTLLHRLEGGVDGRRAAQVGEVLDPEALRFEGRRGSASRARARAPGAPPGRGHSTAGPSRGRGRPRRSRLVRCRQPRWFERSVAERTSCAVEELHGANRRPTGGRVGQCERNGKLRRSCGRRCPFPALCGLLVRTFEADLENHLRIANYQAAVGDVEASQKLLDALSKVFPASPHVWDLFRKARPAPGQVLQRSSSAPRHRTGSRSRVSRRSRSSVRKDEPQCDPAESPPHTRVRGAFSEGTPSFEDPLVLTPYAFPNR